MKIKLFSILFYILLFLPTTSISAQISVDGLWEGVINTGALDLTVYIEIDSPNDRVLLSVPLQNINDQIAKGVTISGDTIFIDYSNFNASYKGIYNRDKNEIIGNWTQGRSTELNLKKVSKKAKINRPQTPKPPYPYQIQPIIFHNSAAGIDLAGTLTIPKSDGPFPLVILISGSGPQDRNSEILEHKPFLVLSDHLSRNGIAVLRYDDRGVGASGGHFSQSTSADFASDVRAAVRYAYGLDHINQKQIGLLGHSEGGLIAPMVAADNDSIGFIISLAGPGVPIAELMTMQNKLILEKAGMSEKGLAILEERLPKIYALVNQEKEPRQIFDTLVSEVHAYYEALPVEDQPLLAQSKQAYYLAISSSFFTPWFRYFLAYDPGPSWQKVKCPVLALNGSEDIQVSAKENLGAITKNLEAIGHNNHREIEMKGYNHLMQKCKTCTIGEYATIETTFDPEVLEIISDFLKNI